MKIWIGTRFINTDYFRTWCLNEDLEIVYFIHQPKSTYQGEFSLPLLFSSAEEAKRFYEESWMAMNDGVNEFWCLDKKTSFCWLLYFKLHNQQLALRKVNKKTHKASKPHEDKNNTGDNPHGAVPRDNISREPWYNRLLISLHLRGRR